MNIAEDITITPQGPLIPGSTNFKTHQVGTMKVETMTSDFLTDGIATLEDGRFEDLVDPTTDDQIATKIYVDESGAFPMGPNESVQFNNSGLFEGSSDLIFDGTTLTVTSLTDGTVTILSGLITGLNDPVNAQDAVNKKTVDNNLNLSESTVSLNSSFTYSAGQMVNGIIYRDPIEESAVNSKIDTTASATAIISQMPSSDVGTTSTFYVKNVSNNDNVYIYLEPGVGVTFNTGTGGVTIPKDYILKAKLIIQTGSTILMYIESIDLSSSNSTIKFFSNDTDLVAYNVRGILTNRFKNYVAQWHTYGDLSTLGIGDTPYTWDSVLLGQITRQTLPNNVNDFLPTPASEFFTISGQTGGYRFIIRNVDTTYSVTLTATSGWTLDSNADWTIGPGTTAITWFHLDSDTQTITVYMIGKISNV